MADLAKLTKEATTALETYHVALDAFWDKHLPQACSLATTNVTDARLAQVEADLRAMTARMNSSPSFGLFLLDLALSFIPVVGGHVTELLAKKSATVFRELVIGQRAYQLFKVNQLLNIPEAARKLRISKVKAAGGLDPKTRRALLNQYQQEYLKVFSWAKAKHPMLVEQKASLEKALRSAMGGENIFTQAFEFSTPVVNDWFQAIGSKLLALSDNDKLKVFANKSEPKTFAKYYELATSRLSNSPNAYLSFIVWDICSRQRKTNSNMKETELALMLDFIPDESFMVQQTEQYTELYARLPQGNDLATFVLVTSELFEATVWLMFLGDPKNWFATKDPGGKYYNVPRSGGSLGGEYTPAYFALKRSLPDEIIKHLLDHFHPELGSSDNRNFREYYTDLKKKHGGSSDRPKGYRWGTPDNPDFEPWDTRSTSYGAEDTALANLQAYFSRLYASMQDTETHFAMIMQKHVLQ